MAGVGRASARKAKRRQPKRLGRGPGGQRDVDMDSDEDDDDEEDDELSMVDIRARVLKAGYTEVQLTQAITKYESMDIWMRVANGAKLRFIDDSS
ncbi:hypothetical protein ONZ45_g19111 [Pleurotus djamor]|nr:hypothetical protein ONZ45_g19111 [Pleurotus djamor]